MATLYVRSIKCVIQIVRMVVNPFRLSRYLYLFLRIWYFGHAMCIIQHTDSFMLY